MIYISLLCLLVGFPLSKKEKIYKNIPGNELAENKNFYLQKFQKLLLLLSKIKISDWSHFYLVEK